MNQRFLLALALTAIVIVLTPQFFGRTATLQRADSTRSAVVPAAPAAQAPTAAALPSVATPNSTTRLPNSPTGDTVVAQTAHARYVFTSAGAAPLSVTLDSYPSRRAGVHRGADLISPRDRAVNYTA